MRIQARYRRAGTRQLQPESGGNNFLFRLMGVEKIKVAPGGSNMMAVMQAAAGARSPVRVAKPAITFPAAASERRRHRLCRLRGGDPGQGFELGLDINRVICPSGSAGTHASLVAGFYGNHSPIPVIGINVSRPKLAQEELVHDLVPRRQTVAETPLSQRGRRLL